ncbi:hypothetical protein PoB_001757800 [Plakobranchus ocellatus]|uniref:Uncharacterized protein n=1 Tax=Plakobranchus ocellatus TaxID=259542 RepID=A0AAV3Z9E6_9GAST|nr:hypothetical protein PoB_001757800 [Plakobranchus ocellatus]
MYPVILSKYKRWCTDVDQGELPPALKQKVEAEARQLSASSIRSSSESDDDADIVCFSPYGNDLDIGESASHVNAT